MSPFARSCWSRLRFRNTLQRPNLPPKEKEPSQSAESLCVCVGGGDVCDYFFWWWRAANGVRARSTRRRAGEPQRFIIPLVLESG